MKKISILFDTGAFSSFINKDISEIFNLPIVRKERRFIQTFEDKNAKPPILNAAQTKIKRVPNSKFENIERIFVVPKICSPVANQKVKAAKTPYKHLVILTLAKKSPTNENLNIHILIGSVIYWNFLTEM